MAPLGYQQTMQVWVNACGSDQTCIAAAPIAAAITFAESGNDPGVIQQGQPYGTTGWGLWQITPGNSEPQFGIDNSLLSAQANANAAVAKYKSAGDSFTPWTTFTGGQYLKYLQAGAKPPAPGASTPSPSSSSGASAGSDYGIGAFGSSIKSAIAGAGNQATQTGLGVLLVLGGVAIVAIAVWVLLPESTRAAVKSVPGRVALAVVK